MFRAFLLSLFLVFVTCRQVSISNVNPRLDSAGNIVNAHDGCLVEFNGTYYIYGTVYGHCHQSTDLNSWKLISTSILPSVMLDNSWNSYWMPNVARNSVTGLYVMTFWDGKFGFVNNSVPVAVSATPYGPFELRPPLTMKGAAVISDTINFFVDADTGKGYVRYNTRDAPLRHVIELLSSDWMSSTGQYSVIFQKNDYPWYDGGGVFKRNGLFYATIGVDCCFCQWGSDAAVFVAKDPLGEWTFQSEANFCADGTLPAQHNLTMSTNPCSLANTQGTNFTIPAQQFNFVSITAENGEKQILYYGERFRSSPDGIKANDFQAWIPISFEQDDVTVQPMKWIDNFTLSLP